MPPLENGAAAAAADDTTAAPPHDTTDAPQTDPALESRARDMGWVPKEKFRGPEDQWKPADEFVRRGEEVLPIVNAENRKLRKQLADLEASTAETLTRVEKMGTAALARQREQIVAQYEAQKVRAVELGDKKLYDAATKGERDALKDFDKAVDAKDDKPADKGSGKLAARDQETLSAWQAENPWFGSSPMLRGAADEAFDEITKEMPGASMEDRLAAVRERVAGQFPDRFGRKAARASAVESPNGRDGGGPAEGSNLWAKVPKDAHAAAKRDIESQRLYDPPGAKKGEPLSPAQLKTARESWAQVYLA